MSDRTALSNGLGSSLLPPKTLRIRHLDSALEAKRVSFSQIVEASYSSHKAGREEERRAYGAYLPRLIKEFEKHEGEIQESYFCKNLPGGAILTDSTGDDKKDGRIRIHTRYPPEAVAAITPEFEEALWRCMALSKKATQLCRTQNSRLLHKLMFSLLVYLLSVLDSLEIDARGDADEQREERRQRIDRALKTVEAELADAHAQYKLCANWGAELAYWHGMLWGMGGLAVILLGVLAVSSAFSDGAIRSSDLHRFLVSLGAGGIGAIVSVMARLSSNKSQINYHAEHKSLTMIGVFRPLLGAVFGAALYVLIAGQFLNIGPKAAGGAQMLYFLAGLSFLAGFSERLAPDALAGAARSVSMTPGGEPGQPRPATGGPGPRDVPEAPPRSHPGPIAPLPG